MRLLAHAGGWDELLLAAAVVILVLMLRPRRKADRAEAVAEGPCLYCGRHLPAGTERCPTCGFRARRTSGSPTAAGR